MEGDPLPYGPGRSGKTWMVGAGVLIALLAAWACGLLIEQQSPGMLGRVLGDVPGTVRRLLP